VTTAGVVAPAALEAEFVGADPVRAGPIALADPPLLVFKTSPRTVQKPSKSEKTEKADGDAV